MAEISRLAELINKQVYGTLTEPEQAELDAWGAEAPENRHFLDTRASREALLKRRRLFWEIDEVAILGRLGLLPGMPGLLYRMRQKGQLGWIKWSAAAVVLVGVAVLGIHYSPLILSRFGSGGGSKLEEPIQLIGVVATTTAPTLTIDQTLTVRLDSVREGQVFQLGLWSFVKQDKDHFAFLRIYEEGYEHKWPDSVAVNFAIPGNGSVNHLLLSDKSKAHLYDATSCSFYIFPYDTMPGNRTLNLIGKADFDINHDVHPFRINTVKGAISVLGTSLIVQDIPDNDSMHVILLSGKVLVRNKRGIVTLIPGEEASFTLRSAEIAVAGGVPIPDSTLKDSEIFDFSHKTLIEAMEEIKKCYGMTAIRYEDVDTLSIGKASQGYMTRDLPLRRLLDMMTTKDMHFAILGKTIKVSRKDYDQRLSFLSLFL